MIKTDKVKSFDPERIAYWFFRLNGCLILDNFLVHHPQRGFEGTDIDVLAVRFPFRRELASPEIPTTLAMKDHPFFETTDELINIYLVEVKRGRMGINPSWEQPEKRNMERLLLAIGSFPEESVKAIAERLCIEHSYIGESFHIQYVAVGEYGNEMLPNTIECLSWYEILSFIYKRLHMYHNQKIQHNQWESTGRRFYTLMQSSQSKGGESYFVSEVKDKMKAEDKI